ncbi:MAG: hypothetical protein JWN17_1743 [Frankiales bacterium]|nr:hypothetical protein [Frankiales bacterium]
MAGWSGRGTPRRGDEEDALGARAVLVGVVGLLAAGAVVSAGPTSAAPSARDRARVAVGADGYLYIAQDWTVACQDRGQAARVGAAARDLTEALRTSGRQVVVVLGPNKSTTVARHVPAAAPARDCGDAARAAVWRALTTTARSGFLDLRPALATADRQVQTYWRKDTHWTPTGGAVYARQLARRLDPQLAKGLTTRPVTYTRDGDLAQVLQQPSHETVRGLQLVNPGVTVQELPYTDVGTEHPARRTVALAAPGARVVPGRTLLIGDSFDSTALEQLAPLFAQTEFLYPGESGSDIAPVVRQVEQADTVVIEVVERFAERYRMFDPDAVAAVQAVPPRDLVRRVG